MYDRRGAGVHRGAGSRRSVIAGAIHVHGVVTSRLRNAKPASGSTMTNVGSGTLYVTTSCGRSVGSGFSREPRRRAVCVTASSPIMIQPKLLAGLASHVCTSLTIATELNAYAPFPARCLVAEVLGSKSPPGLVQEGS